MRFVFVLFFILLFSFADHRFYNLGDLLQIGEVCYRVDSFKREYHSLGIQFSDTEDPILGEPYSVVTYDTVINYDLVACAGSDPAPTCGNYFEADVYEYNTVRADCNCSSLSDSGYLPFDDYNSTCSVDEVNRYMNTLQSNYVALAAQFCIDRCYVKISTCEDSAPPLITDTLPYRTCDRPCDSVGYVEQCDNEGNCICVADNSDSSDNNTTNDSNSTSDSNDSNSSDVGDSDDLQVCGSMTINLLQNGLNIDSYVVYGTIKDPYPAIHHCDHFSLWQTSTLPHSFRAQQCSGFCVLGDDLNSSGTVSGTNGENNVTLDVSSLVEAINNSRDTIGGKIDNANSKLDAISSQIDQSSNSIVESINGLTSVASDSNSKLDNIVTTINDSSNFIVAAVRNVGDKIDTSNYHLSNIENKLDIANNHLNNIENVLTGENIDVDDSLLSSLDGFADNLQSSLDQLKSEYDNLKNFVEGNSLSVSKPTSCSPVFSIDFHGRVIKFDLCSSFSTFRPIIYFFVYFGLTLLSIVITFRGLKILVRV